MSQRRSLLRGSRGTFPPVASAYYPLESNLNASVGGVDGVGTNVSGYDNPTPSWFGDTVNLQGTNDYITFADDDIFSFNAFSICYTQKLLFANSRGVLHKDTEYEIRNILTSGQLRVTLTDSVNGGTRVISALNINTVVAYEDIVITYDGTVGTIYLNGVAQTTTTNDTGTFVSMVNSSNDLIFGESTVNNVQGNFGELIIFDYSIGQEGVDYIYDKHSNDLRFL